MTKKLLFAALSLAAFAACTDNDFESQQKMAEELTCPVKFTVINNDAQTRAYMDGSTIRWQATTGDLFTLYHGVATDALDITTGYWNAAYKTESDGSQASLSTPTMIKQGYAVMFWPVDTTFRIKTTDHLSIVIPEVLEAKTEENKGGGIENHIPYVSDLVEIKAYDPTGDGTEIGYKNTAGKDREYPVYMRPMASQLTLNADYNGTDATIAELYTGDDAIDEIKVTSIDLLTDAGTEFTKEIPVTFTDPTVAIQDRWAAATGKNAGNNWKKVTTLNVAGIVAAGKTTKLTTKCLDGNAACKFLILPQAAIAAPGVLKAGVVVNTIYGKVLVGDPTDYPALPNKSYYTAAEYNDAWYRYVTADAAPAETPEEKAGVAGSGDFAGKFKVVAKDPKLGMEQTINFITNKVASSGLVKDEPVGTSLNRYVMVNLNHLDMSDLHIKSDKQLRDVVKVWKKMNLPAVTVWLDGDANNEFTITQKTIKKINELNDGTLNFRVKPCQVAGEVCNTIVITGSAEEQELQDIAFIIDSNEDGTGVQADVALADEGETTPWKWVGTLRVTDNGVNEIINRGTMENNAAEATLATYEHGALGPQNDIMLVNDGTWNIKGGTLFVQFDVKNNGEVKIAKTAEYREDGAGHIFYNYATNKPSRFGGDDDAVGVVENKGVFATVNGGRIYNYALIQHADKAAKTYITRNQIAGSDFANAFSGANKMGTINLPFDNKDEDNISISATAPITEGFVSVTVSADNAPASKALDASVVGTFVNSIIVNGGIDKISDISAQIKYVEIAQPGTEIAWEVDGAPAYDGLMVLSNVNIKLGTTVTVNKATYLGSDATMYVGGTFTNGGWAGYYGDTAGRVAKQYVTY